MKAVIPPPPSPPLLIWWVLWLAITNGLVLIRFFLAKGITDGDGSLALVAIVPLLISAGIRFALLPRMKTKLKAFPIFIVGLATAEACGLLGIFIGGTHIDELFGASLVMLLLYAPLFARRYDGGGSVDAFRQS